MLIILRNTFDVVPGDPHLGTPGGPYGVPDRRLVFELRRTSEATIPGRLVFEVRRVETTFRSNRAVLEISRFGRSTIRNNRGVVEITRLVTGTGANRRLKEGIRRLGLASPRKALISQM